VNIVVVGGGIAGIVSAILLKKKADRVYLIEKEKDIGGLYRSFQSDLGIFFDYGSHFLRETGIPDLDEVLFGEVTDREWRILDNLKGGAFYKSHLNPESPFVDARLLSGEAYQRGIIELLEITDGDRDYCNLKEQLCLTFGETLTTHLFQPILKDKIFGCELDELAANAHSLWGLSRILALTPCASREVKKSSVYDQKFAYHSSIEGASPLKNFYPINRGIDLWIDLLKEKLDQLNVEVITDTSIESIGHAKGSIQSVQLGNQRRIDCDQVIWTIPVPFFFMASGLSLEPLKKPLRKLHTSLFHFAFDKPFPTDVHFIQCYEPTFNTFRVTLYPNIQQNHSNNHHLTAEVVSSSEPDLGSLKDEVRSELELMGVVVPNSEILFQRSELIRNGFPFPTPELQRSVENQICIVQEAFNNITFLGRTTGKGFIANQVLADVYEQLASLDVN